MLGEVMGNWEKKSNGYKINYSGDRKDLSTYFKATGSVSKSVEDQFQNLFNKNYVYTINDYNREQKAARASKIKKRIIFVCVIVVLVMSWFIASINGLNKYGIGYDLNLSTFELSIKKGALKSNPV